MASQKEWVYELNEGGDGNLLSKNTRQKNDLTKNIQHPRSDWEMQYHFQLVKDEAMKECNI